MNNLGLCYKFSKKYSLGEDLLEDCLQKRKKKLGVDSKPTLTTMYNLADLYEVQEKMDLANSLFLECWQRRKELMGEDHADCVLTKSRIKDFPPQQSSTSTTTDVTDNVMS
mmetsp:Transcript_14724/g.20184  ORF Transcript_14724/g.20184 Transcript_14724/m.20184 type:complete len:111 (+) Transcript_14724:1884-2216(+)